MKNTQIELVFSVFGDNFSPDTFSNFIEINPSCTWKKGDKSIYGSNVHKKESYWAISIKKPNELNLDTLTNSLLLLVSNKASLIKEYIENNSLICKVDVIVHMHFNEYPSIYFNENFINFLSKINGKIDVNFY